MIVQQGLLTALFTLASIGAGFAAADEPKNLDKIPKPVMESLNTKFPHAKIEKWTKETENGKVIYDLEFKQNGRKAEADIAEDGSIQNFEREFDAKKLPKAVVEAVEKRYPKSAMKEVLECTELKEKKEVHAGFEIVLETEAKKSVEVTVAKDGKILEDSSSTNSEKK